MAVFEPCCLATSIGSLPHTDPQIACFLILKYLPSIPAWPQLPKRSFSETMYIQFCRDFPGVKVEEGNIYIDTSERDLTEPLSKILKDYESKDIKDYAMLREEASGLYAFLSSDLGNPLIVKGQITGPVSCGLSLRDEKGQAIIYNETIMDALSKHLALKAIWQEKALSQAHPNTMLWIDEPFMSIYGSAFVPLSKEQVIPALENILKGISGLKGIHCCGNTDWSLLLSLPIDVLSFDAYNYSENLSLYLKEVKVFIDRGGVIAWGIVPNDEESLKKETASSLKDRLEEAMAPFSRYNIPFKRMIRQGLLTPSCGLSPLSPESSITALEILAELSERIRRRYK